MWFLQGRTDYFHVFEIIVHAISARFLHDKILFDKQSDYIDVGDGCWSLCWRQV